MKITGTVRTDYSFWICIFFYAVYYMCGIVGYIGKKNCSSFLLDALEKLEYRGYDSSGIAVCNNHKINLIKKKGRISVY